MAVCAVGGRPGFIHEMKPDEIQNAKALIADYTPDIDWDALASVCRAKGRTLIINAGYELDAAYRGRALPEIADAVIYDFAPESGLFTMGGGGIVSDGADLINGAFSYHNCGRPRGAGCTLDFENIIGGDLRINEWAAELIGEACEGAGVTLRTKEKADMASEPFFRAK